MDPATSHIINGILSRVGELSEVLSGESGESPRASAVNDEVSQAFNRGRRPETNNTQHLTSTNIANTARANTSMITAPSPVSNPRRYFPALNYNRRFLSSSNSQRQAKKKKVPSGPFIRDIILLSGPEVNVVPRQSVKVQLMESGHIIYGFQLMKEWKDFDVEINIRSAFGEKLADNVDIEILMSVHNTLHPPCIPPNQTLNGFMVHKVFKDKPIYIRPSIQMLTPPVKRTRKQVDFLNEDDLVVMQVQ